MRLFSADPESTRFAVLLDFRVAPTRRAPE
jgi:hypothetical protein